MRGHAKGKRKFGGPAMHEGMKKEVRGKYT
jgi:hypothetical protein